MKELNKRLIVSDCDGTLLTSTHIIPDEVRAAIYNYVAAGGVFAVCTGRMIKSILPWVRNLGLKGLVAGYQGTVIAEIESGKILKKGFLKFDEAAEICRFIEAQKQFINTYSDEVLYTDIPKDNPYIKRYEDITGVDAVKVGKSMSEYVFENKLDCQKITSIVAPSDREWLYTTLLKEYGARFDVTCSASSLVEVSPLGDNKGAALEFLAKHFGIDIKDSVAIGDNLNDLSMIKIAGTGIAVGNAVQALKDAADYVSVTNDEGAVAEVIEKFGFKTV